MMHFIKNKWWLTLALFMQIPIVTSAQNSLQAFLDSAIVNNPEAVSIYTQLRKLRARGSNGGCCIAITKDVPKQ